MGVFVERADFVESPSEEQHKLPSRKMRVSLLRRMLVTMPLASLNTLGTLPAHALLGEVTGVGFTQADDKSWDFTLPSPAWKLSGLATPRAEHPARLFHVTGAYSGSGGESASFELVVEPSGAKSNTELGQVRAVGEKLLASQAAQSELKSADIVPGSVKGSKYYSFVYATPTGSSTSVRLSAKQGRTYYLAVSLPAKPSAGLEAEAKLLLDSFKAFPVNIICITQSNSGTSPVPGSCY